MFKITLGGSSVIYVILNGMCVCVVLNIWWSTCWNYRMLELPDLILILANFVSIVYNLDLG